MYNYDRKHYQSSITRNSSKLLFFIGIFWLINIFSTLNQTSTVYKSDNTLSTEIIKDVRTKFNKSLNINEDLDVFDYTDLKEKKGWLNECRKPKGFLNKTQQRRLKNHIFILASPPGSGNTFIRLAIESATRIWTGAVYSDESLKSVMKGEGKLKEVLFIKTHYPCEHCMYNKKKQRFATLEESNGKVGRKNIKLKTLGYVFVLRNPIDAFVAEFHRNTSTLDEYVMKTEGNIHTGVVNLTLVKDYFNKRFLDYILNTWMLATDYYLAKNNTHIVYFDDFKDNRSAELEKIAIFVNKKANDEILDTKMVKLCGKEDIEDGNLFRRPKIKQKLPFKDNILEKGCKIVEKYWNKRRWGECLEV